ncbi:unnamed protein product [Linum trigynum]|uniref:Retrotransposon Copia-like N-terminal domain-containing protein n=1 Tax=Linum trigynum TaxID=586398 RepID=A0AAV2CUX8_9ROSI
MAQTQTQAQPDPMADPYFLHASEQPGVLLVGEKLTPTNYNDWSKAMYNALGAKNKLGFIDGTILAPTTNTDPLHWFWTRNNIMVLSWIQQAVEPGIRKTLMSLKIASEAWQSLKARYGQRDIVRVAELIESLSSLQQGNQTLNEYYGHFIAIQDELDGYQPIESCACTPTSHQTCLALKLVLHYKETNYVIQFLRGLNDNYSTVRSQVLFGETLPSIDKVFQRLLQHERQQFGSQQSRVLASESIVLATQGSQGKRPYCTYCKRNGHTEDVCYHKHGWPPGMTPRVPTTTNQGKAIECTFCKRRGHTEDSCFHKHGWPSFGASKANPNTTPMRIEAPAFISQTPASSSSTNPDNQE